LSVDKLIGMTRLEVEPGVFSPHAPAGDNGSPSTISGIPHFFSPDFGLAQHPRIFDGRLVWLTTGYNSPVRVHRFDLNAGTYADADRVWTIPTQSAAQELKFQRVGYPKLAFSPDGRFLYVSGMYDGWYGPSSFAVHRLDTKQADPKTVFVGVEKKPGSDNAHFQRPEGLDVDEQGRVFVCDFTSNRIQVFGADAKFLRTIRISQPYLVRVDRRRGGIYVLHVDKSARAPQWMLTRLKSVDDPTPTAQTVISGDMSVYGKKNNELLMAVDAWAENPRVWVTPNSFNVQMYEDREKNFVKLLDFHEAVKQAGLVPHMMNAGNDRSIIASKVSADATTERLYYHGMARDAIRYDLAGGKHALQRMPSGDFYADRGFDARGFLYTHVDGSVTRHDPRVNFVEVPFDYGTLGTDSSRELYVGNCQGVLPLKDQAAGKGFCNGMGVNARGDVAVASPIFYVPKFDDKDVETIALGDDTGGGFSNLVSHRKTAFAAWQGDIAKALQRGEKVYSVKLTPGRVLAGDTIWTFDWTGELRGEDVIPGMRLVAGVQIDAEGCLYTMFDKPRLVGGKPFLTGRVSGAGAPMPGAPVTGTFIKTPPNGAKVLMREAPMPMSSWPQRPEDVVGGWVEGAEWLYAGVGPVGGSPKSSSRHCTDWYGRSFVPENYRQAVGVLDVNGNLIMHVGRYGNADSGGPNAKVKIGGDEIAFTNVFGLTATDKYLCVSDLGSDRIVVLRLNYHVEEFVPVK
jgi:6-phosphogluconolactonase (cycloisomerase 2 family)